MKYLPLLFLLGCSSWTPPALADWKRVSDITLGTSVAASIFGMKTWEKRGVATLGHLANFGVNYGLKYLIRQERPDGTDNLGMPSGHSQICVEREAWVCGGFVGLAVATGVGRYMDEKHDWRQITAGGALGAILGVVGQKQYGGKK